MKLNDLQFYHAKFNQDFFGNKLETAIIEFKEMEGLEALFESTTDPFIISLNTSFVAYNNDMYMLTILFHEMIHQYCFENDIEDIDEHGNHNNTFFKIAESKGMIRKGYGLSKELSDKIAQIKETYEKLRSVM